VAEQLVNSTIQASTSTKIQTNFSELSSPVSLRSLTLRRLQKQRNLPVYHKKVTGANKRILKLLVLKTIITAHFQRKIKNQSASTPQLFVDIKTLFYTKIQLRPVN